MSSQPAFSAPNSPTDSPSTANQDSFLLSEAELQEILSASEKQVSADRVKPARNDELSTDDLDAIKRAILDESELAELKGKPQPPRFQSPPDEMITPKPNLTILNPRRASESPRNPTHVEKPTAEQPPVEEPAQSLAPIDAPAESEPAADSPIPVMPKLTFLNPTESPTTDTDSEPAASAPAAETAAPAPEPAHFPAPKINFSQLKRKSAAPAATPTEPEPQPVQAPSVSTSPTAPPTGLLDWLDARLTPISDGVRNLHAKLPSVLLWLGIWLSLHGVVVFVLAWIGVI